MSNLTHEASQLLEKALTLSTEDRGALVDRLIKSLDEGAADEDAEEAWSEEIKRRVDDVRSGRVAMIPGDEVRRRLGRRLLHGRE
jgi:putative addiction module component (TIGR02574 family)